MIYEIQTAKQVAKFLLDKKAVILKPEDPFTWASGWKSPIYCDNRVLLSFPDVRNFLKKKFAEIIREKYPQTEALVGVATAGIAHAALIADELEMPMAYARTKAKDHGTQNLMEGKLEKGSRVMVIEDLISTGKSSLQAVQGVLDYGLKVENLLAIFTYGFPVAEEKAKEFGIDFITLSDYNILAEQAVENNYIQEKDFELLKKWRENPSEWGK